MSKSTDAIRQAFELDQKNRSTDLEKDSDGHYLDTFTIGLYGIYERAYKQGQRDMIEALKPVGYMSHVTIRTISCGKPATAYPVASSWVKYPLYILPEHAQKIQDMGFLPEDEPK